MKWSQRWLRTFVSPELDSAGLADALTMAGLEVEALEPLSASFAKVVVGRVSSVELHPNADRLRVCKVDTGSGTLVQVVCGAPNVAEGMRAPFAPVGAKLAGSAINRATLRSVESFGMLCSERELGLSEDSGGLMVLPNDAPVGADLAAFLELDDSIFTLKLTPNRGDCLSILGVAREVAAITGAAVKHPVIDPVAAMLDAARPIVLEAPEGCPRYCGRVLNLSAAAARTPWWMRTRLERCGLRCVDPIVDVTNYVMLELGQPLHAFDNNCLSGGIRVRWGTPGEQIKLLNGASVALDRKLLVIADEKGPVALAGIMGGEESGVKPDTRAIFLESAFFSPTAIAGRPRALGLESDAAYRFERGVDFAIAGIAMERATHLMLEICGGGAGAISEAVAQLPQRNPVRVRPQRVCKILGAEISASEMSRVFDRLGIAVNRSDAALEVTPPSHRFDLAIEEDFVEEIARIHGYDRIAAVRS
jgi:phenylalanyl-tRNA synthetase beta chain